MVKAVWKEIRVAALCGVTLSACNFVKLMVVDRIPMTVALIVCITLVVVVLVAKIIGCVLPLTAEHIGFDPAVMSSPFITTIVDALSLLVYFGLSTALLHL
jgi:magnesium transporter